MSIQNDDTPMEVLAPSAVESLERAQIDVQIATAHQYPRSLDSFRKRAMSMACMDDETAESCLYCRPVGKEQNDKGQWVEKFAEGASIRLAEIVAASYGNIRVASSIVEQTDRFVRCVGICHDLETNYAGKSECVEATVKKDGQPYSERQRALIAKVALAKAYRDAIFKVVPRALAKPVYEAAKRVAAGQGMSIEQRRAKVKGWLAQVKVHESRMFAALNVAGWSDVGEQQLMILTGLRTSIGDGDVTLEEAFPSVTQAQTGPAVTAPQPAAQPAAKTTPATKTAPAPAPAQAQPEPTKEAEPSDGDLGPQTKSPPQQKPKEEVTAENHPTCRHCNTVVEDMASHNCPQMQAKAAELQQEAAKKSVAAATTQAGTDSPTEILESVKFLAAEASLTDAHVLEFCKRNKIAKPEQTSLNQLADSKLKLLIKSWPNILPELVAIRDGK